MRLLNWLERKLRPSVAPADVASVSEAVLPFGFRPQAVEAAEFGEESHAGRAHRHADDALRAAVRCARIAEQLHCIAYGGVVLVGKCRAHGHDRRRRGRQFPEYLARIQHGCHIRKDTADALFRRRHGHISGEYFVYHTGTVGAFAVRQSVDLGDDPVGQHDRIGAFLHALTFPFLLCLYCITIYRICQ